MEENNPCELKYSFPPFPFYEKSLSIDLSLKAFVSICLSPESLDGWQEQKSSLLMLIHQELMAAAKGVSSYSDLASKATEACTMAAKQKGNESGINVLSVNVRVELPEEERVMLEKIALEQEKNKNA